MDRQLAYWQLKRMHGAADVSSARSGKKGGACAMQCTRGVHSSERQSAAEERGACVRQLGYRDYHDSLSQGVRKGVR